VSLGDNFARLSTAAKLLLILTAVLLPIGVVLTWVGETGIHSADAAIQGRAQDQTHAAARAMESLIARNALALRLAANAALAQGQAGACDRMQRALAISPGLSQRFELEDTDGKKLCAVGDPGADGDWDSFELVAPGDIQVHIAPASKVVAIRAGVIGGMATSVIAVDEFRAATKELGGDIRMLVLKDDSQSLPVLNSNLTGAGAEEFEWPIAGDSLVARFGVAMERVTTLDRLVLLLPVLMWVAAALLTWLLVSRLLAWPLRRLERAVIAYRPGEANFHLPGRLGPSTEIASLGNAFARTIAQVDQSERESTEAFEGQRRLVREVHHRVKNNLQVVASLLNIHSRTAEAPGASAAYAGISRRVGALSIVHRNHFAEMEENRGIALRPLLSELAAELRVSAPEEAIGLNIDLDLDTVHTTQDVAVAVAFLVTEIVEYAMFNAPKELIEITIRRTSELTARLSISSQVLNPDEDGNKEKDQFERIIAGLAKQLRSPLERKLGRYSVDLPVFP